MRAKWVITFLSAGLVAIRLILIVGYSIGSFGIFLMVSEWGFTLVSLGGGVAVTSLVVDQLLAREDRETWNAVKEQALQLIQGELVTVFIDLAMISGAIPSVQTTYGKEAGTKQILEEMKKLSETNNIVVVQKSVSELQLFQQTVPPLATSLFEAATRLGDLELRFSTKFLPPKLVILMNDLEKELLQFKRDVLGGREMIRRMNLSASTFELQIARQLQRLIRIILDAVNDGTVQAPEISFN
jgi:hypothetical protein